MNIMNIPQITILFWLFKSLMSLFSIGKNHHFSTRKFRFFGQAWSALLGAFEAQEAVEVVCNGVAASRPATVGSLATKDWLCWDWKIMQNHSRRFKFTEGRDFGGVMSDSFTTGRWNQMENSTPRSCCILCRCCAICILCSEPRYACWC